jgi:uncharacterized membrane-anchored protein YhcB (DUF1043 family)
VAYLIFQILWFLLAAAAIGVAVGWLCGSLASQRRRETGAMQTRAQQDELEGQREQLEARLSEASGANKALQEEIAQLRQAAEADARARRKLEREHSSALIKLEAREREVARLSAELGARPGETLAPQTPASPVTAPLGIAADAASPSPPAAAQGEADDRKRVGASGRTSRGR